MNETATDKMHHDAINASVNIYSLTKQILAQNARLEAALKQFPVFETEKTHITLHHSLTEDSLTVSWPAIRKYHKHTLGWRDIGYHAGIEEIRYPGEYEILIGRPFFDNGAHCRAGNMNRKGFGFCFVGNFDLAPPPEKMLDRAAEYLATVCRLGNISPDNIEGHNKYDASKTCPGKLFDIDDLRNRVIEYI